MCSVPCGAGCAAKTNVGGAEGMLLHSEHLSAASVPSAFAQVASARSIAVSRAVASIHRASWSSSLVSLACFRHCSSGPLCSGQHLVRVTICRQLLLLSFKHQSCRALHAGKPSRGGSLYARLSLRAEVQKERRLVRPRWEQTVVGLPPAHPKSARLRDQTD